MGPLRLPQIVESEPERVGPSARTMTGANCCSLPVGICGIGLPVMLEYWIPCTVPPHHIKRQIMILSLLFATIYASELKLPIFSETKNAGFTALKGRIIKCNWECRGNKNTQQSARCFRDF